jgi:hypothetical protein
LLYQINISKQFLINIIKEKMMKMEVKAISEGYENITPHLVVKDAAKAIEFYKKVFGTKEEYRSNIPGEENKIIYPKYRKR